MLLGSSYTHVFHNKRCHVRGVPGSVPCTEGGSTVAGGGMGVQGGVTRPWYGAHYIKHHPVSHDIWILAYLITLSILCVVGKQICGHGQHKLDLLFRMPRVDTYQHMDHALQVTNSCYVPVNTTKISWAGVFLCRHVFDFVLNILQLGPLQVYFGQEIAILEFTNGHF